MSVTELVAQIRDLLESGFADVYVEGEIVNFARPGSGHYYFTLKDKNSQMRTVMFKMQNRLMRFVPEDGMVVVARGRVSCYPPRGSLQMIVDYMEPKGAGALAAAFEQRKRDLAAKGYFDPKRKKPLPDLPACVGLVTSPTGAALYDALRVAFSRHPNLHVILSPTLVQGDEAAPKIAQAIGHLEKDGRSDVILLIRGGGSAEDLWAFNEMPVVEAIHHCSIPIVTGIGHEIDFTLADFCADLRAPTPTAAAEVAVPRIADMLQDVQRLHNRLLGGYRNLLSRHMDKASHLSHRLRVRGLPTLLPAQKMDELTGRLHRASIRVFRSGTRRINDLSVRLRHAPGELARLNRHLLTRAAERLAAGKSMRFREAHFAVESLHRHLMAASPARLHRAQREGMNQLARRLGQAGKASVQSSRAKLENLDTLLGALSPLNVLGRGYSLTRNPADGMLIRSSTQVEVGQKLEILLKEGSVDVDVTMKKAL